MWAGIGALLQALPKILELFSKFGEWVKDKKFDAWLGNVEDALDSAGKAQTPEEKRDAAKKIVGVIRSLR